MATFPEAFLPLDALDSLLRSYASGFVSEGFIHVGLRADEEEHLLEARVLIRFLEGLLADDVACVQDLQAFVEWTKSLPSEAMLNVGCLFGIDADNQVRVCFHPKLVRSKFETSALREKHMHEAKLVSVIALEPRDPTLQTLYIQPLLCSDALSLPMDLPRAHPLRAITAGDVDFCNSRIEHIDVVSVACCTPQEWETVPGKASRPLGWHPEFRTTAQSLGTSDDMRRHHGAPLVLANFRVVKELRPCGLSGTFVPRPPSRLPLHFALMTSLFGTRADSGVFQDRWFQHNELDAFGFTKHGVNARGFIASIVPSESIASLLKFQLSRIGVDGRGWDDGMALQAIGVREVVVDGRDSYTFYERSLP